MSAQRLWATATTAMDVPANLTHAEAIQMLQRLARQAATRRYFS